MIMKLFAVRDVKADSFGAPMSVQSKGVAMRGFLEACIDSKSELNKYPEDFMLYEIGTYEPNSAAIVPHPVPQLVGTAADAILQAKAMRESAAVLA